MYTDFYNLTEKPFNLTPSPRFLYLGEKHKEALALLKYGVIERKGFILLTGEVGTGKTTMVHVLLESLESEFKYVHLSNPLLSPEDFMNYLAFSAFKKWVHFKSKAQFLVAFETFLRQCMQDQQNFNLIIDEAHKLSFDLLEEIRLLSNMETGDAKLINIFLVGQPELNEKLSEPRCRPLLQRISIRYHIPPLNLKETTEYVTTRLTAAGAKNVEKIFSRDALEAIHQCSGGYPRMINILADNAMLVGYSRNKRKIVGPVIKECFEDMQLEGSFNKNERDKDESAETENAEEIHAGHSWRWVVILILLAFLVGFGLSGKGRQTLFQLADVIPLDRVFPFKEAQKATPEPQVDIEIETEKGIVDHAVEEEENKPAIKENEGSVAVALEFEEREGIKNPLTREDAIEEPWKTMTVKAGDTLLELATKVYGRADEKILKLVQQKNPNIRDVNVISVGQKIDFPPLSTLSQERTYTVHIASYKPFNTAQDLFQKLTREGYEVYIMPAHNPQEGKVFRVTLGSFSSQENADTYASDILNKGISSYAETIELEMK